MNSAEMFNREKKAAKLAAVLFKARVTVEEVLVADQKDWIRVAEIATRETGEPTNPPNKDNPKPTIDAVLALLARAYADEADRADQKADQQWEESQEYGANRCPERE